MPSVLINRFIKKSEVYLERVCRQNALFSQMAMLSGEQHSAVSGLHCSLLYNVF